MRQASPSPRRGHPEADLQREVVKSLRWLLPRGSIVHHSPGEQRRGGRSAQAIALGMGLHPGFADIVVLSAGRVLFLELKSATGRLSEAQAAFRDDVRAQGHGWARVRSLDDALGALRDHDIPTLIRQGI